MNQDGHLVGDNHQGGIQLEGSPVEDIQPEGILGEGIPEEGIQLVGSLGEGILDAQEDNDPLGVKTALCQIHRACPCHHPFFFTKLMLQ